MIILLQWLVEHVWVLYAACVIGVAVYVVRALVAKRERNLALFTLERDTATARVVQAWAMVVLFIAIGVAIFVSAAFILPGLSIYNAGILFPTPTSSAGVEFPTPDITSTPSPVPEVAPTFTPLTTTAAVPTPPPPESVETPTPEPAETPTSEAPEIPEAAVSGELYVRFGDFSALVGYSLPAAAINTAQPLPLTIYWRALEGTSAVDYLVFTHLLAGDGRLIAQHDGVPAGGARPTTGWVSGETIVDSHLLTFYDAAYTGPARLVVGLYEPSTGRVLTEIGDDSVVLPVAISVVPQ
ncbi:MAG: hypothetical protein SWK90_19790 [Chloroflexota bacterium]|nr:hypothetical protein [Chloroflexota bacterium]